MKKNKKIESIKSLQKRKEEYYIKKMNIYFKNEYVFILKSILITLFLMFLCIIYKNCFRKSESTEIDFVYVGEGNGAVIKTKSGKNILIDTGEGLGKKYEHGLKTFMPYILNTKSKNIYRMYLSHLDSDHAGGGIYISKFLNVKNIFIPYMEKSILEKDKIYKELKKVAKEKDIRLNKIHAGFSEIIDEIKIDVLWPDKSKLIEKNKMNNNSIVMMLNIYGYKILFTGDIEKEAEKEIVKMYKNSLKADILVVPHHGSKTSSSEEFLKCVKPDYAICSLGKDNMFKHPNDEIVERYKKYNIKFLRTDENGCIKIKVYKDNFMIESFKTKLKNSFSFKKDINKI